MDPGRIPEILSLETEPDEPTTETRWPSQKGDILELGTGQVKVVCTLAFFFRESQMSWNLVLCGNKSM